MKPKKKGLKTLISNSEKFSFGIDYLRLKIDDVNSKLIYLNNRLEKQIDFDNSNWIVFDELGYEITAIKIQLTNGKGLIYNYSFFGISIPLFIIIEYTPAHKKLFNAWGKIDFYGSYFRMIEIGEMPKNFLFGDMILDLEITRIDYRLDFFNYKGGVIDKSIINARINSKEQTWRTNGKINSWRYGNKDNKTIVVRGYDKKLDISKKGKFRLYGDYNNWDNIFRLEWEFLNSFCKGFTLKTLDKLVNKKIKSYISLNKKDYDGKYLTSYNKLDLRDEFQRTRYCKMMSAYIKEALKNNINVYDFVDIELEKLGLCKEDIEKIRNKSINIKEFDLLPK